jgi:hypothetical protein
MSAHDSFNRKERKENLTQSVCDVGTVTSSVLFCCVQFLVASPIRKHFTAEIAKSTETNPVLFAVSALFAVKCIFIRCDGVVLGSLRLMHPGYHDAGFSCPSGGLERP